MRRILKEEDYMLDNIKIAFNGHVNVKKNS